LTRLIVPVSATLMVFLAAFVFLYGSGTVIGQEAGLWPTTKALVETKVLNAQLVRLDGEPERYVGSGDRGRAHFDAMMAGRGLSLAEQMGSALIYTDGTGRRCVGG